MEHGMNYFIITRAVTAMGRAVEGPSRTKRSEKRAMTLVRVIGVVDVCEYDRG